MGTQRYVSDGSFVADQALAKYRVVIYGDIKGHCKYPTIQDANKIAGVTQESSSASGDILLVRQLGVSKAETAGSTAPSNTIGLPLRAFDAVGRVHTQADAWVSGDGVVGYNLETSSASGDIIEIWVAARTLLG